MTNNSVVDFAEFRNANLDEALLDSPQNRNTGTGGGGVIAVLFHDGDSGRSDNTDPHSEDGADEVMLSVKAKRFNLGSIRAENLVSPTLRVL